MARSKKSRKVGQIGVRSVPKQDRAPNTVSGKPKKRKGNAAGSRHSAATEQTVNSQKISKDPRIGSKKPVSLVAEAPKAAPVKRKYFSPTEELKAIENDQRLASLLDKLEAGKRLTVEDQSYVDETLARHKVLCELLGIAPDEDEQDESFSEHETDPLVQYEQINIDDFK